MKISKIMKLLCFFIPILTVITLLLSFFYSSAIERLENTYENALYLTRSTSELVASTANLTNWARSFVINGNQSSLNNYLQTNISQYLQNTLFEFQTNNATGNELIQIQESIRLIEELTLLHQQAFAIASANNDEGAVALLFGSTYENIKAQLTSNLNHLSETLYQRLTIEIANARIQADIFGMARLITTLVFVTVGIFAVATIFLKLKPINDLATLVNQVSNGLVNVNFDTGKIKNDEIGILTKDIYNLIHTIKNLCDDLNRLVYEDKKGNLKYRIETSNYQNAFYELMEGANQLLQHQEDDLMPAIDAIFKIGKGDFNIHLEELPGEKAVLTVAINNIISSLESLYSSVNKLSEDVAIGNLDTHIDKANFEGAWESLVNKLNNLVVSVKEPISAVDSCLKEMAHGHFSKAIITDSYEGSFNELKQSLNLTSSSTLSYVNEIAEVLQKMSKGDFNYQVTREYIGDYSQIKESINTIIDSLNKSMHEIQSASSQLLGGSSQVSQNAMFLAEGATRQTTAIDDLEASLSNITNTIKESAQNAITATEKAKETQSNAEIGEVTVQKLLSVMNTVKESSESIAKVINVISDIAFQTNLLALNASVEAARAGEHGRGFAVVADEVRSLASKSQHSAKNTEQIIETDVKAVLEGVTAVNNVEKALSTISNDIKQIFELVVTISEMAKEQESSTIRINENVQEIANVVQSNTATAEENAAISEELNAQAEVLSKLVSEFNLKPL